MPELQGFRVITSVLLTGGALLAAGCGSTSPPAAASSPRQAVVAAAQQAAKVSSVQATVRVSVNGVTTVAANVQSQTKPTVLISESLSMSVSGQSLALDEIINDRDFYLKGLPIPQYKGRWIKIPLSDAGALGAAMSSMISQAQSSNPLAQTRALAGAKDVRRAGSQAIGGVRTTKYQGYYTSASALAAMPAAFRKAFGSALKEVSGHVGFTTWIDSQHHIRKMVIIEQVKGQTVTTTATLSGYNQPVSITIPSGSQVATIPGT